ncbi:unnamed protein product [Clonostachys rosea]|uniref:F-box domain-containing protein n=1 Tax=Bionectria ochroleuca TaxID=29856 RepID=A0ABY6U0E4_BIOOC|nr:unnamed protein product [Clonostachys rosea]
MECITQSEQTQIDGDSVGEAKCHILLLPTDLIQVVIDCLSEDEIASTEKDLLSLCLTSKALLAVARSRLYRFNADWVENNETRYGAKRKASDRAALDWAIEKDRKETAELVMEITPEVFELCHLSTAIQENRFEIAWMLLRQDIVCTKVEASTEDSPIFAAVGVGHIGLIDYIGKIQSLDVSMFDRSYHTVLHYACYCGHLNLVQRFLDLEADPYAKGESPYAMTPLMAAILCKLPTARYDILRTMLACEPSLPHSNEQYENYMRYISEKCNLDDLELFIGRGFFDSFLNDQSPQVCNERWRHWIGMARISKIRNSFEDFSSFVPANTTPMAFSKKYVQWLWLRK